MGTLRNRVIAATLCLIAAFFVLRQPAPAQQILQYGFETRGPVWKAGPSEGKFKVAIHQLTDKTAHSGVRCEHIQVKVEKASFIHYTYTIGRAPVTEDLNVALWLKSNRPGIRLFCRVVLPRERDPKNLANKMTVLLECEPYQSTRWKLVTLRDPVKRLNEQKLLLNRKHAREVITADAYVDQLVLNVADGPGQTDVYIDDLEVGPVYEPERTSPPIAVTPKSKAPAKPASRNGGSQLNGAQLQVGGENFFMRCIRHTGIPLKTLRDAGFNTIVLDESTLAGTIEEAANLGFWLIPAIRAPKLDDKGQYVGTLASNEEFSRKVSRFLDNEAVLGWYLGSNLETRHFSGVSAVARALRQTDGQRLVFTDVWEGYRRFGNLEPVAMGSHRWPLMTSLELPAYRTWLENRRNLGTDSYSWTWIQTHLPQWYIDNIDPDVERDGFKDPVGPLPEQIRLQAYTAIAAGYRGLAFWSDRYLSDSHKGRDRLLALALLNQELHMLEPLLVQAHREVEWIGTSNNNVQAAVIRTDKSVLVLPMWTGHGSQLVPGQAATAELSITVPGIPVTASAWEVSPGRIQSYKVHRVTGGSLVKLRNFSLTAALVFTSDLGPTGILVRLQDQQRRVGKLAAQWLHDQAIEELTKVEKVQSQLDALGHTLPDAMALLDRARASLIRCQNHRRNGEHTAAFTAAEIALRSLRLLRRAHWDKAVRNLDVPTASPYAVSFYSLPRHWKFLDSFSGGKAERNVLPDGDFETPAERSPAGWVAYTPPTPDPVTITIRRVSKPRPRLGKQCVMIQIKAKDPNRPLSNLEGTFATLSSPTVRLQPGTTVQISGWMLIPAPIGASADGALFFDSIGGEPLAVRQHHVPKWRRFALYRRVPPSGQVGVHLGLAGLGTVYFDDVRIEPITPPARQVRGKGR